MNWERILNSYESSLDRKSSNSIRDIRKILNTLNIYDRSTCQNTNIFILKEALQYDFCFC